MFKSYLLLALTIVAGLSSIACSASASEALGNDNVSNAYARLIEAEQQLLQSELAVEAKKSASYTKLLASGSASWLEDRQQKLVVDILGAKLNAYQQFASQAKATLTGGEMEFGSAGKDSTEMRQAAMQELQTELTSLRQAKEKSAQAVATLPAGDSWVQGYQLRYVVAGHRADVVAAKIMLLERLNASRDEAIAKSKIVSTADKASTVAAAWKRPSKDSNSMRLLITQAELQIKLSQHHLANETQRLTSMQELVGQGMATQRSLEESQAKVDAIKELLKEQQDNLSVLRKDLDASPDNDLYYTSIKVVSKSATPNESPVLLKNLPVLPSVLNRFELGQANYLRREAILKGEMYREVLSKLEQSVALQMGQPKYDDTSTEFSDVLIRGQQRELEQYRWKIKKTELQRELADAQIALLNESDGSQSDNLNMLVSTGISSSVPLTLPSRFLTSDPFGLQTRYSAFVYRSPVFEARRPLSIPRADLSSVFRPVINRDALSLYRGLQSSGLGSPYRSSFGGFNRVHSHGYLNPAFRRPGQPPWYLPGSPTTFGTSPFGTSPVRSNFRGSSHFNSFGRSSLHYRALGPGY